MKRMVIGTLVAALTFGAVGTAPKAHAGDKEWAVAGKILAGIMVLDALTTPRYGPVYQERHVVHHVPVYSPPPVRRPSPRRIYSAGYRHGYRDGHADGYRLGSHDGYRTGSRDGFRQGARVGYRTGYSTGYHNASWGSYGR